MTTTLTNVTTPTASPITPITQFGERSKARAAERAKDVDKWFANHEATYRLLADSDRFGRIEELVWAEPGTSMYSIRYLVHGPALLVYGDMGSAVYRWSSHVSVAWIAGCSLHYFAGKCEASEEGRTFVEWDRDEARERVREEAVRRIEEDKFVTKHGTAMLQRALRAIDDGQQAWDAWLHSEDPGDLFGDSWYEYVPNFGKVISIRCEAHLAGLQRAAAQLKAKGLLCP